MSEGDLDRVREDLAVMRQAIGPRPPFGREHVWVSLALAVVGIVVAALTAWTNISTPPATPASAARWAYLGLVVGPALFVLTVLAVAARRRRADAPLLWREARLSWVATAVAVPLYLGFVAWAVKNGTSAGALTAATLFLAGLFALVGAVTDRGRRYTLGWAVATLLAGVCAPAATYESAGLVAGCWLFLGGFSTAAVMAWQLRGENDHAAHRL
jgi:hypothetical protein